LAFPPRAILDEPMSFERRPLARGGFAIVATRLERAGFLAAFTERGGGASAGPFESLNLSQMVGDDPGAIAANRRLVVTGLELPGPFSLPEQVHGTGVARVESSDAGAGFDDPGGRTPGADALVTGSAGVPVAVLTADCLPVALASPATGLVAAVHAGWRGLAAGILAEAVSRFDDPGDVLAAVGPAIGPDHYEVGGEVVEAIGDEGTFERRDGRTFLDLASTAEAFLRSMGVGSVDVARVCTACEPGRFFSHRRDGGSTGRQALVAVRR
jgi:YfiH family protein